MQFESDVFISYAHIDNETVVEGQEGWVTTFHRALELRVAQLVGEKPKIFRDPKLQGNDYFSDTLVDQLPGTAILVSVFSPRYVKSEWCSRELEEFVKASAGSGGIRVADKSRVFKVLKTPVPPEEHPEPVRPLLGYEFFKIDPDTGRARELDKVFGPEAERDFWLKLDDLAHDLAALLETLKRGDAGGASAPSSAPEASAPGAAGDHTAQEEPTDVAGTGRPDSASRNSDVEKAVVYLAQVTTDLKEEHAAVKRDLKQAGHEVLPDSPLPLEAEELERYVGAQLDRSRLSVHLIGGTYGIVPEGTKVSLTEVQNDLAIERGKTGDFARLVWIPPQLDVDSDRQRDFLDRLRSDPRIEQGADLLEVPLEDLKTQIHAALEPPEKEEPQAEASPSPAGAGSQIYLICDQRDLDAVNPVADFLFGQGHGVTLPAFEGDEAEVRDDHEENLKACEAALIYWGGGNNLWLRRKLRELKKAAGLGREEPWRAEGVLIAPPESPDKSRLRTHDLFVLNQAGGEFSPEALAPFLAALAEGANAP